MADVYVEVLPSPSTLRRCDACGKLMRWPEEVRVYAPSASDRATRYEHVSHPPQPGAQELKHG